jgi:hypothetical protein
MGIDPTAQKLKADQIHGSKQGCRTGSGRGARRVARRCGQTGCPTGGQIGWPDGVPDGARRVPRHFLTATSFLNAMSPV